MNNYRNKTYISKIKNMLYKIDENGFVEVAFTPLVDTWYKSLNKENTIIDWVKNRFLFEYEV